MEQLLDRPEIQSAVIPFIVGLAVAAGLRKVTRGAWIWALFAAFLCSALLINGTTLMPLTGTRKIILLVLGACLVAGLGAFVLRTTNLQRQAATGLVIVSVLWIFWTVMERREATAAAIFVAGAVALNLFTAWGLDLCRKHEARLHGAGFGLLLGTGLCAALGSSALLGQLGLALAAGCGGLFLAWVLLPGQTGGELIHGRPLAILPYLMPAVTIGLAAVIFARLPWYALAPLAAIPLATSLLPYQSESRFMNALVSSLPGLLITGATAFWVWQAGSSSASGY
jgi:hypothetical protein